MELPDLRLKQFAKGKINENDKVNTVGTGELWGGGCEAQPSQAVARPVVATTR